MVRAAQIVHPLITATLGDDVAVQVSCWDGSREGPADAVLRLRLTRRRALRRLFWAPNELGFARAYVSGDLDIEGDLFAGLAQLERIVGSGVAAELASDRGTKRAVLAGAVSLGAIGLPPRPPAEEVTLRGRRHSLRRDSAAITHHYDVSNDFYEQVLGPSMTYSCGYWARDDGPDPLTDAQYGKCDLVARKLALREGMRVLDVGCGWGSFVLHAAREYGAHAVGVTLSQAQADYARKRVAEEGLNELVEIRVQDYRDIDDGPFDAISSIGMAEHVGMSMLPTYAVDLYKQLAPGGRLLNHAISRRPGESTHGSKTSFIGRYVFPDGELEPLGVMVSALEQAGFEVRDVESLREHYALTLRAWVQNLERNWNEAVRLAGTGRARVWRLYMAACALSFQTGRIGINQTLAVKPDDHGNSGMPRVRSF